ncbi:cryptochrome/photolyase family protein [Ochrovirga pacifica]|uniref:cryptochrome/photolyase family protein n=1 Tax=Ochrovirga pacifica TaxID=1042376 RepID=UPI0002557FD5|nr:cryptochrome/photolyase family protein [Ochrovirga pacifica]
MAHSVNIVFPHQLFQESPLLTNGNPTYLIEEVLFFKQYKFHKQKIAFHRASMQFYKQHLTNQKIEVRYIDAEQKLADLENFESEITKESISKVHIIDPVDNWLLKKIQLVFANCNLIMYDSPNFILTQKEVKDYFKKDTQSYFQTNFYKKQRKDLDILMDPSNQPKGGKWTYDAENRKKYPKGKTVPNIHFPETNDCWKEAVAYVNKHFSKNYGNLENAPYYPVDFKTSKIWLNQFFEYRFSEFGTYQDALVKQEVFMHHSLLSPLLNSGLLNPLEVVKKAIAYGDQNNIPINSIEGFVRQIIGWREFVRGVYIAKGSFSRTHNFWKFKRKIPQSFYKGTTGIEPVDIAVKKALKTGYCHHIERLMVLGNFMLLCEFNPDEVYQWFMELFIDAYDWVMVPNVYGMSQFSDGGILATKPYISGSNYLKKMGDYGNGEWQKIWDGLFWSFIDNQRTYIQKNHRLNMMLRTYDRFSPEKKEEHLANASAFFEQLEGME